METSTNKSGLAQQVNGIIFPKLPVPTKNGFRFMVTALYKNKGRNQQDLLSKFYQYIPADFVNFYNTSTPGEWELMVKDGAFDKMMSKLVFANEVWVYPAFGGV